MSSEIPKDENQDENDDYLTDDQLTQLFIGGITQIDDNDFDDFAHGRGRMAMPVLPVDERSAQEVPFHESQPFILSDHNLPHPN